MFKKLLSVLFVLSGLIILSSVFLFSAKLPAPVQISPLSGTEFHNYPRTFTMKWRAVPTATHYIVQIDCLHCKQAGKWDSEVSTPHTIKVKGTSTTFTFWGDNRGRWRVRAVRLFGFSRAFSNWSPWWYFSFKTGGTGTGTEIKEPKRFFLDFSDAYLVYEPSSNILQIATQGNVLSYGGDWQKCKMKPYLYHIKQNVWKGFYWKVNTSRKEVYMVKSGTFCKLGGIERRLNFTVDVVGDPENPTRFFIRFGENGAYLVHEPSSGILQIVAVTTPGGGVVLSYGGDWQKCKMKPYLYHLKQNVWRGFYWKVNTSRKQAWRNTNGTFCQLGGSDSPLNIRVRVVE